MTLRRGTKAHNTVLINARNVRCYSLSNGFTGRRAEDHTPAAAIERLDFAKLRTRPEGGYCVDVHNNLWYDFEN